MLKNDFIKFLRRNCWEKTSTDTEDNWRYMTDYAEYTFEYIDIDGDIVRFTWERMYWGGSDIETKEYTFDSFVNAYEHDYLRN